MAESFNFQKKGGSYLEHRNDLQENQVHSLILIVTPGFDTFFKQYSSFQYKMIFAQKENPNFGTMKLVIIGFGYKKH